MNDYNFGNFYVLKNSKKQDTLSSHIVATFFAKSIDKNITNGYNEYRKSHPMTVML